MVKSGTNRLCHFTFLNLERTARTVCFRVNIFIKSIFCDLCLNLNLSRNCNGVWIYEQLCILYIIRRIIFYPQIIYFFKFKHRLIVNRKVYEQSGLIQVGKKTNKHRHLKILIVVSVAVTVVNADDMTVVTWQSPPPTKEKKSTHQLLQHFFESWWSEENLHAGQRAERRKHVTQRSLRERDR